MSSKQELLQVKLEFGHKASCRTRPTSEGFTHDWIVFVQGQDNKDISHFVEKVVFNLHESFHKPKRVIKEPPYKVEEHGYGSFSLPIDVYFKNKEQPRTVRIEYDLFLPAFGNSPIHNNRTEALKFLNPPEEFKKKVLRAGGEMLNTANGTNSSPSSSSSSSINGNSHRSESSVKDTKETALTNDYDKQKKPKLEKPVKTSNTGTKTSNTGIKHASLSNKRPSDDDEILPKVKKKKKKVESPQLNLKSNTFIPIEPPASGVEEQHHLGNGKDVRLKIKSLPSSSSSKTTTKKPTKQQEKVPEKPKEKKKEKVNSSNTDLNSSNATAINGNTSTSKRKSISNSKTKIKSPQEKTKVSKSEERKVEKLMFRRESGDSWSSSTSSNSPGLPLLGNNVLGKNNALGTLMAELYDDEYDDDEDDVDISTPFQSNAYSKLDSSLSNNNVQLNKKDIKSSSNKPKAKTKEIKETKKDSKDIKKNSKNGHTSVKSPTNTLKAAETSRSSSKTSSKTKPKSTKSDKNGHQSPSSDLVNLHKELSSLKDKESLQKVVDILEKSGCFVITESNLEFDLVRLDMKTIQQIQKCVKR